jgi:Arc/MetJ-type ribon-helix-helix transcriptional regulator
MQIDLTPEQQDFVRQAVASGRFERADDAVQVAMGLGSSVNAAAAKSLRKHRLIAARAPSRAASYDARHLQRAVRAHRNVRTKKFFDRTLKASQLNAA